MVVDDLDGAVRLDEVKVLGRGDGDGLVPDQREELEGEKPDGGGRAVDEVLLSARRYGEAHRGEGGERVQCRCVALRSESWMA